MSHDYVQYDNIVPLLAPQDIAATAQPSEYVSLNCHDIGLYVIAGAITATSADEYYTVTVVATTSAATGASEVAIPFSYRTSGVVNTNTWTAVTTATTAGVNLTVDDDNKILYIHIDPAAVLAELSDATHVRAVITPGTASLTAGLFTVIASVSPRYRQTTMISATG